MGVKSLVQGLNAAATAGFEPRTVWSEVRRRNRLALAAPVREGNVNVGGRWTSGIPSFHVWYSKLKYPSREDASDKVLNLKIWCDDKSRVACKAAPPLFFFSFGTQLSFFLFYNAFGLVRFSSYKDQCWAEKVIIWIVLLNLHGATRSSRCCNNRTSLSAWLSFFLQHVGQHRSKNDYEAKQKKVSASTNPTDRVLNRRPDTFFRLRVRYFLAPLRAWPVASSIAITREKSTSKNQAKGRRSWLLTQAFEPRSRRAWRCATLLDRRNAIFVGCSKSCKISLLWDLLLQLRNWLVGLPHFFGRFVFAQRISCFSFTAMAVAVSVNFPADRSLFAEDVFCTWMRMPHHHCSPVLGVALGDNESVNYTLRIFIQELDLTKQEKTGAMSFHIIVENDQAELEPKRSSRQRTRARYTYGT